MADRKIDFEYIKQQIDTDQIISIMDSLGVSFIKQDNRQIIFYSICHHPNDFLQHKPKLYYYIQSKSMFCYVCGFNGDIFSLVQKVLNYTNIIQAVEYVCNICKIDISTCQIKPNIDQWQSMKKFLPNYDQGKQELVVYDKNVLDLFKPFAHVSWIDDGISKQAMAKFNIGWYARNEAITIPVFFRGNLIGIRGRYTKEQDIKYGKYRPIKTLNDIYKFPTSEVLYGFDENGSYIKKEKSVLLFEGEKSCIKSYSWGIKNTLATFGSSISKSQINLLLELNVEEVIICFDSDFKKNGDSEYLFFIEKIKKIIKKLRPYFQIFVCYNNQGYDGYKFSPVDFSREQFYNLLKNKEKIS